MYMYMSLYENEIVIQSVDAHISSVFMGVVFFLVHTYSMHKFVCCGMVSTVMCVSITTSLCSPDSEDLNIIVGRANMWCSLYV